MFHVIAIFNDGHEEKQGNFRDLEYAEARAAGLKTHYPGAIVDCRIEATGKDKNMKKVEEEV
jgi:hypothetical protein